EIVENSAGDGLLGRIEEKAAATLGSTSGIAFHRRVPSHAASNTAAAPANTVETQAPASDVSSETLASPVESSGQPATPSGPVDAKAAVAQDATVDENADVLEMPVEVGTLELKATDPAQDVLAPTSAAVISNPEAHLPSA